MCLTTAAVVFTMLVTFHTYLAATNQTTYEMMKREYNEVFAKAAGKACSQSLQPYGLVFSETTITLDKLAGCCRLVSAVLAALL